MAMTIRLPLFALLLLCFSITPAESKAAPDDPAGSYRLSLRDQIEFIVYDEPDLTLVQRIDGKGQIRVPLLGTAKVVGMTVRETETMIAETYVRERILKNPMVTIRVVEYAPKEISVLGAVRQPGKITMPIEQNSLDIVDVISKCGGFTGIAKSDAVRVTRLTLEGKPKVFTVDVERMINGRDRGETPRLEILPGDVIYVDERIF